jgi:hypothetical protein
LATKASCEGGGVEGIGEVALAEERGDTVADLEAGDPGACRDDRAGGVGAGNQGNLLLAPWISALRGKQDDVSHSGRI